MDALSAAAHLPLLFVAVIILATLNAVVVAANWFGGVRAILRGAALVKVDALITTRLLACGQIVVATVWVVAVGLMVPTIAASSAF